MAGEAVAVFTVSDRGQWYDGKRGFVVGTISMADTNDYEAGGIILDLSAVLGIELPLYVEIHGQTGWSYHFVPGATNALHKVKVYTGVTEATDETEMDAAVRGDTVVALIIYPQLM